MFLFPGNDLKLLFYGEVCVHNFCPCFFLQRSKTMKTAVFKFSRPVDSNLYQNTYSSVN